MDEFESEESELNPYYQRFKSHQLDIVEENNFFRVSYSKQGIINLKTSSQDQALEIVRRRIDEIGTNEPNILKRGNDRILVELPGLDDPMRIKSLLGKTANLTFRFVTNDTEGSFGAEKLEFEGGTEEATVSKRIILSGENLFALPFLQCMTKISNIGFRDEYTKQRSVTQGEIRGQVDLNKQAYEHQPGLFHSSTTIRDLNTVENQTLKYTLHALVNSGVFEGTTFESISFSILIPIPSSGIYIPGSHVKTIPDLKEENLLPTS